MNEKDTEEFIRRLRGQLTATRVLAYAALALHPEPSRALSGVRFYAEHLKATLLGSTVTEQEIEEFDRVIQGVEQILARSAGTHGA